MIRYIDSTEAIDPSMLKGFFEDWISAPSLEMHLEILRSSYAVVLAMDESVGKVVGFITAISDGVHSAHIPLLEVLPEYRNRSIGSELVKRMLEKLKGLYGISLMCDEGLQVFYGRFGMSPGAGMNIRNY